jgi:hypothetical protein
MIYMKSVSGEDGSYTLTASFELGTNPDISHQNSTPTVLGATPSRRWSNAKGQEAEPRSYSNAPIGLNFAGYVYSEETAFDPDLAIAAKFHSNIEVLAYVRSFEVGGSRPSSM